MAAGKESYPSSIPININDLLNVQGVESQRIEFKKAWHNNSKIKGGPYWQIVHTITAFANDCYNVNGGYVIIGVEEKEDWDSSDNRQIIPCGVQGNLEQIQKEITGACRGNIQPPYVPILQPEVVAERKHVLVIWVRPSDERPHMCRASDKGEYKYYLREATQTKIAQAQEVTRLCQYNSTPFDDRTAIESDTGRQLSLRDINQELVQKHLKSTGSELARQSAEPIITLYRKLDLVKRIADENVDGQLLPVFAPRNVALLFFNPSPHRFFKGARTEIAIFSQDNDPVEIPNLTGPIDQQIRMCLSSILTKTKEVGCQAFVAYPERALREAVVNAFHHRSYEISAPHPVKIHIKPNYIEIISYPGPDPSLKPEDFSENKVPPVPSRNRRIADFLKSLKLAEALYTGVGTIFRSMKENKNPTPQFDFNSSYFRVRLPGHPKYVVQSIRCRADNLCAKGNETEALRLIEEFLDKNPSMWSEILIVKLLELLEIEDDGRDPESPKVIQYQKFISEREQRRIPLKEELSKWCESEKLEISTGVKLVEHLVEEGATLADVSCVISKACDLCQQKDEHGRLQLKALQNAHKLFEAMGEVTLTDALASFQYAECKFNLYVLNVQKTTSLELKEQRKVSRSESTAARRNLFPLLKKAEDYVNAAIQLTKKEDRDKHPNLACYYRLLGFIHSQRCVIQKSTEKQVTDCYEKARRYDPHIKLNRLYIPAGYRSRHLSE